MKTADRFLRLLVLAVVLVLVSQVVAEACPTCKEGLASGDGANLVRGYFWSIVFMMSMPFLVFGGMATYFYLLIRRAQAARLHPVSI